MTLLIDYSWQHPAPTTIKAAGYSGALRYLSNDPTKDLTKPEAVALHAVGLSIGLVWETTAKRATAGRKAGAADAALAESRADALGYPDSAVIFYAVDFDAAAAEVMPYFDGGRSKANRPVGVYGSARVVEAVHAAGALYTWQTCAWSGGVVSPVAHVYQRLHPTVPTPIPGTDENALIKEVPLWTAAPAPKPTPVNVGVNVKLIDLSNANTTPVKGPGVKPLQRLLCVKDDGAAGPRTRAALIAAQQRLKLTPDAKFGPTTATALLAEK